jgi:hypothetical protein
MTTVALFPSVLGVRQGILDATETFWDRALPFVRALG